MATEIRELDVSYNGDLADTMFYEPVFMDEDMTNNFRIMPNVVTEKKMQFIGRMEKIVRKYSGCGFRPVGNLDIYKRKVRVSKHKVNVKQCFDEFIDTVLEEQLNRGLSIKNLSGTVMQEILTGKVREGIALDTQRLYEFGDESSSDPAYDAMNGMFTVHYPKMRTDGLLAYTDSGSGSALNAGDAMDLLRQVYNNQPLALKGLPNAMKSLRVSGTVYERYIEDIEDGGGGDFGLMATINGIQTPMFRGLQVIPRWRWNEIYAADFGETNKHIVELSATKNKVIATDLVNAQNELRVWYSEDDEELKVKGHWKMGGDYIHHSLFSVAY